MPCETRGWSFTQCQQLYSICLMRAIDFASALSWVHKGAQAYLGDGPWPARSHIPVNVGHCRIMPTQSQFKYPVKTLVKPIQLFLRLKCSSSRVHLTQLLAARCIEHAAWTIATSK